MNSVNALVTATSTEDTGDFNIAYLHNWLEINKWQAESLAMASTQDITVDLKGDGTELLRNPIFDNAGAFYTSNAGDGSITDETILFNSGLRARKLQGGLGSEQATDPGFEIGSGWTQESGGGVGDIDLADTTPNSGSKNAKLQRALKVTNLITNGTFEGTGATPPAFTVWNETGAGVISQSSVQAHNGTYSAYLANGTADDTYIDQDITVIAEKDYQFTFWQIQNDAGDGTPLKYQVYDNDNTADIIVKTSAPVPTDSWVQITVNFTAPIGCTSVKIYFYAPNGGVSEEIHVDDVEIYEKGGIPDFYEDYTVTAGDKVELNLYTRADGGSSVGGEYSVYNVTGAANIIAKTLTGVTGVDYTLKTVYFTVPAGCTTVRVYYYSGDDTDIVNTVAYFDDVSFKILDNNVYESQDVTVVAEEDYIYILNTRADGGSSVGGRYRIYDVSNAADIVAITNTGITGTDYTEIEKDFTTPVGCTSVRIYYYAGDAGDIDNTVAYFDDLSVQKENKKSCDYLTIDLHNLYSAGATMVLQYSSDNFVGDTNNVFTAEAMTDDNFYLKQFTETTTARYWRLRITGLNVLAPHISILSFGLETEMDLASKSFDPDSQKDNANVLISDGGYLQGTYPRYKERQVTLGFDDDETGNAVLWNKFNDLWENHGLQNFYVAFDLTNSPEKTYLMRLESNYSNPYQLGGKYRNLTVPLLGRYNS